MPKRPRLSPHSVRGGGIPSPNQLRSEYDYRVNLKAELEIRYLHQKLDHFLRREWQTLLEIQEIQIDLMNEISGKGAEKKSP